MPDKRLRYVMIGGGPGSLMGPVHNRAVRLTDLAVPVGGFFSRNPEKNAAMADTLRLPPENILPDLDALLAALPSVQPDFAVVITPTIDHYEAVRRLLLAGFPVVCDKPLCSRPEEAEEIAELSERLHLPVMVTYTYAGYAMPAEARARVLSGSLGTIRLVTAEYRQDGLAKRAPGTNDPRAWRYDPELSRAFCIEDIGVHLEHMIRYVSGQKLTRLAARLMHFTPGTALDDNAFIWGTLDNGAEVSAICSKISVGKSNRLSFNVVGEKGSVEWRHDEPEILRLCMLNQPEQILRRGDPSLSDEAKARSLVPMEHPQGYTEAFSALYAAFCRTLLARRAGEPYTCDFPTARDGAIGIRFVDACLTSHAQENTWIDV